MDYTQISIIKRDGKTEPFSLDKIVRAITKAFRAGGITDEGQAVEQIASDVAAAITKAEISVEEYKAKYGLNYSVLATPAEGLSGRFTRMDRKRYGEIPGVTDRDYYVNSFHVDVREPVSIVEKIRLEAPFHAITRGGHITYVELDGEARKNPSIA
jgi:anaerobic ribonucleoside-triphosphate reductase